MDDFLKFILGAVSALAGSVITQILQARYAGKKKLDEIVAEKQIAACTDAYIMMKRVQSVLATRNTITEAALREALDFFLLDKEEWLLRSRLFLSGKFPDLWFAIRNDITVAIKMEINATGSAAYLKKHLLDLVDEAINKLYLTLGLERIKPEIYQRCKHSLRNKYRRWREQRRKMSSNDIYKLLDGAPPGTSLVDGPPKDSDEELYNTRGNSVSQPSARRREGLTRVCRRRRTASAALPLPAAPETWR